MDVGGVEHCQNFKGSCSMSAQVLGVCYFLYVPLHLKHISKGSSQYIQYCEWKSFLFHHFHFFTHDSLVLYVLED